MSEMQAIGQIKNKISPILQFYNFDEFFTVLSLAVGQALYLASQSQNTTSLTACPLSSQKVQILLRQAMISQFANYQAQDICLGNTFFPMKPFSVGPNGLATSQSSMLLPTFLAENIRCSVPRQVSLSGQDGLAQLDVIAVLARPADRPQLGNFTTGSPAVALVYTPNPAEVPVNIIDLSCVVSGNPLYLSASGNSIAADLDAWNSWIQTLSGNLSPLVSVGAASGVSALMTAFYTNTQQDNVIEPTPTNLMTPIARKNSVKHFGTPPAKSHVSLSSAPVIPGYIDMYTEKEILCNNVVTSEINKFVNLWILPAALSTGESSQASLQAWQVFQIQPYTIPRSQAGGNGGDVPSVYPTIGSRLKNMATVDTKASLSEQPNEFICELVELGKRGRGGFFSSIAGALAGTLIPGSGDYVHSALESFGL